MIASAFIVCLALLFSRQWDTEDGQPLRTWDWSWWTMPSWAPSLEFRMWLVRFAPGLVVAGLLAFLGALLFLR